DSLYRKTLRTSVGAMPIMDRKTIWISLLGGCFLLVLGLKRLYQQGDWALFIIGGLIIAFSISGLLKDRQEK
ncbi:MAG: hypothetical protein RBS57_02205, partial [Desulforhabdus sp.]|nr:hypothetical protein [Desulforhabdus sp.]